MVAAWISAETGVGPSIASGNQTYNGSCADLPVAPMNRRSVSNDTVTESYVSTVGASVNTVRKSTDPNSRIIQISPTTIAPSPIRFTKKALVPADAAAGRSNQNPINRYEQRPTPSHPTKSRR